MDQSGSLRPVIEMVAGFIIAVAILLIPLIVILF